MAYALKEVATTELACDWASYRSDHKAPECTGRILPGEQCNINQNMRAEGENGDDWPFATCRHCVRFLNWDKFNKTPIAVRIEISYHDGSKRILEGDSVEDYLSSSTIYQLRRGVASPRFDWKYEPPEAP